MFLDAGNTLVGMDVDRLAAIAASAGVTATAAQVARAEAAARPALSARLACGRSSETRYVFRFYVERLLAGLGLDDARVRRLAPDIATAVKRVPTVELWSRVLPGVPAGLARLRAAGLRLVVVSNADGTVEEGLARAGLRDLLDDVVDSTRIGFEKPDPRIFAHALRVAGVAPPQTVHVGDLFAVDVEGARSAGIAAALLDPFGDWPPVDCPVFRDLDAFATAVLAGDRFA